MRHALALTLLLVCACGGEAPEGQPTPTTAPPSPSPTPEPSPTPSALSSGQEWEDTPVATAEGAALLYRLSWSWEGARWDEARSAWVFTTDLGYEVGLTAAYVGTWSLELVPCVDSSVESARPTNHSVDPDASYLAAPEVESAFTEGTTEFGVGISSGLAYCGLHALMTPMVGPAPDGFQLDHQSAWLAGWYLPPAGGEALPLQAAVGLAGGGNADLALYSTDRSLTTSWGQPVAAIIDLVRFPARALDGVELADVSAVELAFQFQLGLAGTARAVATAPGPP